MQETMKRWHILLIMGLIGVASLLFAAFEQLIPGQQVSMAMRLLILLQPAVLTVASVATGQALAAKIGLHAPLIDSWLTDGDPRAVLRKQVPPALAAGVAVAIVMIVYSSAILPLVTDAATMANMTRFDIPLAPGFSMAASPKSY